MCRTVPWRIDLWGVYRIESSQTAIPRILVQMLVVFAPSPDPDIIDSYHAIVERAVIKLLHVTERPIVVPHPLAVVSRDHVVEDETPESTSRVCNFDLAQIKSLLM